LLSGPFLAISFQEKRQNSISRDKKGHGHHHYADKGLSQGIACQDRVGVTGSGCFQCVNFFEKMVFFQKFLNSLNAFFKIDDGNQHLEPVC